MSRFNPFSKFADDLDDDMPTQDTVEDSSADNPSEDIYADDGTVEDEYSESVELDPADEVTVQVKVVTETNEALQQQEEIQNAAEMVNNIYRQIINHNKNIVFLRHAQNVLKGHGANDAFIYLLNHNGGLSRYLQQDLPSYESFSSYTTKDTNSQIYYEAIGEKLSNAKDYVSGKLKQFWEWLKNMFSKIVEFFTMRYSKLKKLAEPFQKNKVIITDEMLTKVKVAYTYKDLDSLNTNLKTIINDFKKYNSSNLPSKIDVPALPTKKNPAITLQAAGWRTGNLKQFVSDILALENDSKAALNNINNIKKAASNDSSKKDNTDYIKAIKDSAMFVKDGSMIMLSATIKMYADLLKAVEKRNKKTDD